MSEHQSPRLVTSFLNGIVQIAADYNAEAIVFENLLGWKATGGRKRSHLRQRFHGWLKAKIRDYTEMKWSEAAGKVIDIVAAIHF
jgi:putative transposase